MSMISIFISIICYLFLFVAAFVILLVFAATHVAGRIKQTSNSEVVIAYTQVTGNGSIPFSSEPLPFSSRIYGRVRVLATTLRRSYISESEYIPPAVRPPRVHDGIETFIEAVYDAYIEPWFAFLVQDTPHRSDPSSNRNLNHVTNSSELDQSVNRNSQTNDFNLSYGNSMNSRGENACRVFRTQVKTLFLQLIDAMHERLINNVNGMDVFTRQLPELLEEHLNMFRISTGHTFPMHPAKESAEKMRSYLHACASVIIQYAAPPWISENSILSRLAADLLYTTTLEPAIHKMSRADFINKCIIAYFRSQTAQPNWTQEKLYAYASTYTKFTQLIRKSTDIGYLLDIRANLIAEITKTTIIKELKLLERRGVIGNSDEGIARLYRDAAEMAHFQERNVSRYIKECNYAKILCELRLRQLGGPIYKNIYEQSTSQVHNSRYKSSPSEASSSSIEMTLNDGLLLGYFLQFLSIYHKELNFKFFQAVRLLRSHIRDEQCVTPHDIYVVQAAFDLCTRGVTALQIDSQTRLRIQDHFRIFLEDTSEMSCDELKTRNVMRPYKLLLSALMRAYHQVASVLEEEHHHFVCSSIYRDYVHHVNQQSTRHSLRSTQARLLVSESECRDLPQNYPIKDSTDQTLFSKQVPKESNIPSSKGDKTPFLLEIKHRKELLKACKGETLLCRLEGLDTSSQQRRMASLAQEIVALESHVEQVEQYWSGLGYWQADVQTIDESEDGELLCVIAVHKRFSLNAGRENLFPQTQLSKEISVQKEQKREETGETAHHQDDRQSGLPHQTQCEHGTSNNLFVNNMLGTSQQPSNISGWIICRRWSELDELFQKLRDMDKHAIRGKRMRLPLFPWVRSSKRISHWTRETIKYIQRFLNVCLTHERFQSSQALFIFLTPSPDFIRRLHSNHSRPPAMRHSRKHESNQLKAAEKQRNSTFNTENFIKPETALSKSNLAVAATGQSQLTITQNCRKRQDGINRFMSSSTVFAVNKSISHQSGQRNVKVQSTVHDVLKHVKPLDIPKHPRTQQQALQSITNKDDFTENNSTVPKSQTKNLTQSNDSNSLIALDNSITSKTGSYTEVSAHQHSNSHDYGDYTGNFDSGNNFFLSANISYENERVGHAHNEKILSRDGHASAGINEEDTSDSVLNQSNRQYLFHGQFSDELDGFFVGSEMICGFAGDDGEDGVDGEDDINYETSPKHINDGARSSSKEVEPLFRLISEMFELKGLLKWLRRQVVSFVRLAYGENINRQLRSVVAWLFQEPQILWLLDILHHALFSDEDQQSTSSEADKKMVADEALTLLTQNTPQTLKLLVGKSNAGKGLLRIFHILQHESLNEHLLICFLEILLVETFPELPKRKSLTGSFISLPYERLQEPHISVPFESPSKTQNSVRSKVIRKNSPSDNKQ